MIYHLFDASPYVSKFRQFLEAHPEEFDLSNHCFVIHLDRRSPFVVQGREGNIIWTRNFQIWNILSRVGRADKVIIHGLFNIWLIWYLILRPGLARRCTWVAWGADIYSGADPRRDLKHRVVVSSRKIAARSIGTLVTVLEGDLEMARQAYGFRGRWLSAFYPVPTELEAAAKAPPAPNDGRLRILVGNSGAATNQHLPILRVLAERLSALDTEAEVIVPLSYGDEGYIAQVKQEGRALLGRHFRPLDDFIPPEDYVGELQKVNVAIMNHERQQGLGTVLALLVLGKKVYLRSGTTPYAFFSELGVRISNTCELARQSVDEIIAFDRRSGAVNSRIVRDAYSRERLVEGWLRVLS